MLLKLGYNHNSWKSDFLKPIIWDTNKVPHLLISGISGGGKSVCSQLIINQLLNFDIDIYICDFKAGGDWDNIVSNYAEYNDCDKILNNFYTKFVEAISHRSTRECFLIFDEFASYSLSKDTKEQKKLMEKVSHIAFMGRSFHFHMIFISQQFNSNVLSTAIREQFGIKIYMGSYISAESANMLFPDCNIDKSVNLPHCCGYIVTPFTSIDVIQIPLISSPTGLKKLLEYKGHLYQHSNIKIEPG